MTINQLQQAVIPAQGNRLKRIVGPGPGFARFMGARIAQPVPPVQPPVPFRSLMMRASGASGGVAGATAGPVGMNV